MISDDLLIQLEAAYHGRLSADEAAVLEKQLSAQPDLAIERAAYEQLWEALAAQRGEVLREEMQSWEDNSKADDDLELLEWYHSGQLSTAVQASVQERLQRDGAFLQLYEAYQPIWDGAAAARSEDFRGQMQQWEGMESKSKLESESESESKSKLESESESKLESESESKLESESESESESKSEIPGAIVIPLRRSWRSFAAGIAACLILGVGSLLWLRSQYSGENLVAGYYQRPPLGGTLGNQDSMEQYLADFAKAHRAFQAEEYDEAGANFVALSTRIPPAEFGEEAVKYYQDNIDWMVVLAQVGAGHENGDVEQRLSLIINNPNHAYKTEALALQADLAKWWR